MRAQIRQPPRRGFVRGTGQGPGCPPVRCRRLPPNLHACRPEHDPAVQPDRLAVEELEGTPGAGSFHVASPSTWGLSSNTTTEDGRRLGNTLRAASIALDAAVEGLPATIAPRQVSGAASG